MRVGALHRPRGKASTGTTKLTAGAHDMLKIAGRASTTSKLDAVKMPLRRPSARSSSWSSSPARAGLPRARRQAARHAGPQLAALQPRRDREDPLRGRRLNRSHECNRSTRQPASPGLHVRWTLTEAAELDEVVPGFLVESHGSLDQLDLRSGCRLARTHLGTVSRASSGPSTPSKGHLRALASGSSSTSHVGESLLSRLREGRLVLNAEITSALLPRWWTPCGTCSRTSRARAATAIRYGISSRASAGCRKRSGPDGDATGRPPQYLNSVSCRTVGQARTAARRAAAPEPSSRSRWDAGRGSRRARARRLRARDGERRAARGRTRPRWRTTIRVDVHLLDKLAMNLVGELVLAHATRSSSSPPREGLEASHVPAPQPHHHQALQEASPEDAHAAHQQHLEQVPRVVRDVALASAASRSASRWRRRPSSTRPSSRQSRTRSRTSSATPSTTASSRPKRIAAPQTAEGRLLDARAYPRGRTGQHRDLRRRRRHRPEGPKALQRLSPTSARRMGDASPQRMVFLPGFSTASKVTNVSGAASAWTS